MDCWKAGLRILENTEWLSHTAHNNAPIIPMLHEWSPLPVKFQEITAILASIHILQRNYTSEYSFYVERLLNTYVLEILTSLSDKSFKFRFDHKHRPSYDAIRIAKDDLQYIMLSLKYAIKHQDGSWSCNLFEELLTVKNNTPYGEIALHPH